MEFVVDAMPTSSTRFATRLQSPVVAGVVSALGKQVPCPIEAAEQEPSKGTLPMIVPLVGLTPIRGPESAAQPRPSTVWSRVGSVALRSGAWVNRNSSRATSLSLATSPLIEPLISSRLAAKDARLFSPAAQRPDSAARFSGELTRHGSAGPTREPGAIPTPTPPFTKSIRLAPSSATVHPAQPKPVCCWRAAS